MSACPSLLQMMAAIMIVESTIRFIAVNNTIFMGKWAMRLQSITVSAAKHINPGVGATHASPDWASHDSPLRLICLTTGKSRIPPPLRQLQRRLAQGCQLFPQFQDLFAPVTDGVEPGKGAGEDRIFPAPGEPGTVVEHPQGTQSADKLELAGIEIAELSVAFDQFGQLGGLARPFSGEHHPEILHRRSHPGIVEIYEMRRPVPPED